MILSVHMLAGAAIGSKVKNYWAIFILAIISHFIMDAIPHWEYTGLAANVSGDFFMSVTVKALLDILLGVIVIGWLFKYSGLARPTLWGAFCALLPDGLIFTYTLAQVLFGWHLDWLTYPIAIHDKIHFADKTDFLFWRIALELAVAAIALVVLWRARQAEKQNK